MIRRRCSVNIIIWFGIQFHVPTIAFGLHRMANSQRLLSPRSLKNLAILSHCNDNISLDIIAVSPFTECWEATSSSVNPRERPKIERILQRLIGPAPQSYYVIARIQGSSTQLRTHFTHCNYLIKRGYQLAFHPESGEWDIIALDEAHDIDWERISRRDTPTTLELAHTALELAMEASDDQEQINMKTIDAIANQAVQRLYLTLGTDIRGRTSADTAFSFAMAGVSDPKLYFLLALIAKLELIRVGTRPSFRSKYVLQIVEKLAASGMRNIHVDEVFQVAADCLQLKGEYEDTQLLLRNNKVDMLSPRPLLWLWRFSTTQKKPKYNFGDNTTPSYRDNPLEWTTIFQSNQFHSSTRPLIVDIGCGMGVSLIGLSTSNETSEESILDIHWNQCNYIGCDLNQLLVGFARGITKQWHLDDRVQFTVQSGQDLLESIPYNVSLILIQFPSPFILEGKESGNQQLPSDPMVDFMVNEALLRTAARLLQPSQGKLLLHSNCEDVAVAMRDLAIKIGMNYVQVPDSVTESDHSGMTLRTQVWIEKGGKRAVGSGWSRVPLLPRRGISETEAARELNGSPIHRCLLETVDGTQY